MFTTACDDAGGTTDTQDSDTVQTEQDTSAADTASIEVLDEDSAAPDDVAAPDTTPVVADTASEDDVQDSSGAPDADAVEDADTVEDADAAVEDADTSVEDADATDADAAAPDTTVTLFDPLPVTPPSGFNAVTEGRGFTVYRKDYAGGAPDYVLVVDLRIAELHSVVGDTYPPPTAAAEQRASITHWDDAVAEARALGSRARILLSGGFFSPTVDPASLAHGLQIDGDVVSYGYGIEEFPGYVSTLAWSNADHEATILPYATTTFEAYPNVVGGFKTDVPHPAKDAYTGRIVVGVRDFDDDGHAEALIVVASELQNQPDAQALLTDFGATATLLWTGAESAFFILDGHEQVSPGRRLPHTVAVYEPRDYGCASPCPDHAGCDPTTGQCVCDAPYSGASCETCDGCAPTEVVVDDSDDGFTRFGEKYWWSAQDHDAFLTRANGATLRYTFGDPTGELVWSGRWLTPTPLNGTYKVEVFVASPDAFDPDPAADHVVDSWVVCDAVRYVVRHDGALDGELVTLNHHVSGWITVKDAVTYTDRHGDVRSDDHATPQYCAVQFDAIRWTRVTQ